MISFLLLNEKNLIKEEPKRKYWKCEILKTSDKDYINIP